MTNENRDLKVTRRNELKAVAAREGKQLAKGALEVSRKPLHDLGATFWTTSSTGSSERGSDLPTGRRKPPCSIGE